MEDTKNDVARQNGHLDNVKNFDCCGYEVAININKQLQELDNKLSDIAEKRMSKKDNPQLQTVLDNIEEQVIFKKSALWWVLKNCF